MTKDSRVKLTHLGKSISFQESQYPKIIEQELHDKLHKRFSTTGGINKKKALVEVFNVLQKTGMPAKASLIYRYYFEHTAHSVRLHNCRWSFNEVLNSPELTQYIINKTRTNPKVFKDGFYGNIKKFLQLGGGGVARIPTNFPLGECLRILKDYCPKGGTYIDPSCGWGIRLLAAAKLGLKYRGFDVNLPLLERLEELASDIQKWKPFDYQVIGHGSEILEKALINTGDLVFTSPPYFGLEDYSRDPGQSIVKFPGYEGWKKGFLNPMMKNMFRYLKPGRYCLINIKDYEKFDLIAATQEAGKLAGFEYMGTTSLSVVPRISVKAKNINQDEDIQVFFKPGPDPFIPVSKRKTKVMKRVATKSLF